MAKKILTGVIIGLIMLVATVYLEPLLKPPAPPPPQLPLSSPEPDKQAPPPRLPDPLPPPPPLSRNFAPPCVTAAGNKVSSQSTIPTDSDQDKEELIKNSNFKDSYRSAWNAQVYDSNASIKPSENFIRIFFNGLFTGEGIASKAVELSQVVDISDLTDLIFNLHIKISDFNNEGFPVSALTFMDHLFRKVFQITFTPDKHYKEEDDDCLYPIHSGIIENITIYPIEYIRKRIPSEAYKKSRKVKISFYIAGPVGYRCTACTIEVHNVSLKVKRGMRNEN